MKKTISYNVILISVDAMSKTDAKSLLELPGFRWLSENGCFTDDMKTVFPTVTYPIHTSAITGRFPERHNVYHNEPRQDDVPDDLRKWFWEVSEIGADTLWKAAKRKGLRVASLLWPVSGKGAGAIDWDFPEIMPLRGENPVVKYFKYASPFWLLRTELKWGKKVRKSINREDLDDYCCFLTERLIEKKRPPELITVHFADTDFTRHDFGVGTPEDEAAIVRMDLRIQRLIETVKKRGILDRTVFVVMSDHGQKNVSNGYFCLDGALAESGIGRCESFGMGAYIFADDSAKAAEFLNSHKDELHISEILYEEDLRKMHASKTAKLAVYAKEGYGFADRNCKCDHLGDHGFSNDVQEADALLWIAGGPFEKGGSLGNVSVTDIAPTISDLMGLGMKDMDGKTLI